MKLHIKNMVCFRCKLRVKEELEKLGIHYVRVELGVVEIMEEITPVQREQLRTNLRQSDLDLIEDKKSILVEHIKIVIREMILHFDELPKVNYSRYISEKLNHDYTYLNNVFSKETGMPIHHFILLQKIERAKELLEYDELTISQIADQLHYSDLSHLSTQFHLFTGHTPSDYKLLVQKDRKNLENV